MKNCNLDNGEKCISLMNLAIAHRGPDDSGIYSCENSGVYLGHRRLSILDLSANGHQPMLTDGGTAIVFNGEVYNYRDLRVRLPEDVWQSHTDTEVVLRLIDTLGIKALQQFNGMFAFGIWQPKKQSLIIARDRIGKKPLYYTEKAGIFAFSSEIKALLKLPWVSAELDEECLYDFLTFNKVFPPHTMFKGIRKLYPGHYMIVNSSGIQKYEPFWKIHYSNYSSEPEDMLSSRVRELLNDAVSKRMVSDVPIGAFLSGGVDSSAVVAMMSRQSNNAVSTFSVGFRGMPDYDETKYARSVANMFNTKHYEHIIDQDDVRNLLPTIVDIFDEPLADATSIPIYFICKAARKAGVPVILTGDGADELFCGYRNWIKYIRYHSFYQAYTRFPKFIRTAVASCYSRINRNSPLSDILWRAVKQQEAFWPGAGAYKDSLKTTVLSKDYLARLSNADSYYHVGRYLDNYSLQDMNGRPVEYVDWLCFAGLKAILPNYYLYRADRLGMAHAVELRTPFLDHRLVEFAMSIPGKYKVANNEPKYILKTALRSILPNDVLYRRKRGFCVPLREWITEIVADYLDDNLPRFCRQTGMFRLDTLHDQIRGARAGARDHAFSLWNLYFFLAWHNRWIA